MIHSAPLVPCPRGQTFKMTKWSSDTLSGVPGGWKRLRRNPNSCSRAEGIRGQRRWEVVGKEGGYCRQQTLSLLSVPIFPPLLLHLLFALPHRWVGQPICSGKPEPGPLSPVSGYWHSRSRLGGEGSANRALSLFFRCKTSPDNCTFDLLEFRTQEQLKINQCSPFNHQEHGALMATHPLKRHLDTKWLQSQLHWITETLLSKAKMIHSQLYIRMIKHDVSL